MNKRGLLCLVIIFLLIFTVGCSSNDIKNNSKNNTENGPLGVEVSKEVPPVKSAELYNKTK